MIMNNFENLNSVYKYFKKLQWIRLKFIVNKYCVLVIFLIYHVNWFGVKDHF